MAACSELELEGKPSQEKRLLCSKSFDSSTNKEDAVEARNICNSEMPKTVENNEGVQKNSIDICSLTEEQLHLLLEEATTFNRPKDEDSSILRALRKEIVESDPCGDVNSNEPGFSAASGSHGKKKVKNAVNCGAGKNKLNTGNEDESLMLDYGNFLGWHKPSESTSSRKRNCRNRDDLGASCSSGKKEVQFQSLQDLHSARFSETFDSMRAAGIGRGARKLHKAGRANSFTLASCERSEWLGLPAQVNAQVGRTPSGKGKSKAKAHGVAGEWLLDDAEKTVVDTGGQDTSSPRSLSESEGTVSESVALNNWSTCSSDSSSSPEKEDCPMEPIPTLICDKVKDDSDISLLSCRPLATDGDVFYSDVKCVRHPVEIEMMEFTKEDSTSVDLCCRSFVCNFEGNSAMDVDAPVNFPLKTVCPARSRSELNYLSRNNPHVNGMLDAGEFNYCGGLSALSLPYRSKSVAGTTSHMDDSSKKDQKILQHVDHNGNPVRGIRLNDTPYGSNSYSLDGHSSKQDPHLRKGKRTKLNTDIRKSEDVDGYRGKEDIDSLVEFINSTDRKNKSSYKPTNGSAIYMQFGEGPKNGAVTEKRDKTFVKDNKFYFKNTTSSTKKNNCFATSDDEELVNENEAVDYPETTTGNESEGENPPIVESELPDSSPVANTIPEVINTETDLHNVPSLDSSVVADNDLPTSFAEDFYAVTDVPPVLEESEFRVVVNKQKRRRQAKKPDSHRRHSAAGGSGSKFSSERDYYLSDQSYHSSNYMLLSGLPLSHRSSRGMSDSIRRKSTSSVPPSEHSSADNSDLDSVHSLPVGGSVPPASRVHPHTTPSSMSSTPQASYADIARISTAPSSKDGDCLQVSSNTLDRTSSDCYTSDESGPKFVMDSMHDFPENAVVVECSVLEARVNLMEEQSCTFRGTARSDDVLSEEKNPNRSRNPEDLEASRSGNPKSQVSADVSGSESFRSEADLSEQAETDSQLGRASGSEDGTQATESRTSAKFDKPSAKNTEPKDTVRSASSRSTGKNHGRPPVIIFDNCQPSVNVCDVSFGFDLNEILRLSAGEASLGPQSEEASKCLERLEKSSGNKSVPADGAVASNSKKQSDNKSSPSENIVVISGRRYQWKEATADRQSFNHAQVVNFFGSAWDDVVRDYQTNPDTGEGRKYNKVKYYNNQC